MHIVVCHMESERKNLRIKNIERKPVMCTNCREGGPVVSESQSVSRSASRTSIPGYSRSTSHAVVCTVMLIGCGVYCPQYFFPYIVKIKDRNVFSQAPFMAD